MSAGDKRFLLAGFIVYVIASILVVVWVERGASFSAIPATDPETAKQYEQAIKTLDAVVDVSLKLATTLVGLGAAILVGFKSGLNLTTSVRASILFSTACFLQSALYATLWRLRVAELWVNNSLELLAATRLQYRFEAHFWFFLAGLAGLAAIVVVAALADPKPTPEDFS